MPAEGEACPYVVVLARLADGLGSRRQVGRKGIGIGLWLLICRRWVLCGEVFCGRFGLGHDCRVLFSSRRGRMDVNQALSLAHTSNGHFQEMKCAQCCVERGCFFPRLPSSTAQQLSSSWLLAHLVTRLRLATGGVVPLRSRLRHIARRHY